MEEEAPLDVLIRQVRETEAKREAVEEKLDRTPVWRVRRRTRLARRVERLRAQEQELVVLVQRVTDSFVSDSSLEQVDHERGG